jgi:hypothetical protein
MMPAGGADLDSAPRYWLPGHVGQIEPASRDGRHSRGRRQP